MRKYSLISVSIFATVIFLACQNSGSSGAQDSTGHEHSTMGHEGAHTNTAADSTGAATMTAVETYYALTPCADCEGIETTISLKSDQTFQTHLIYAGRKSTGPGSNEFSHTGQWMKHGADTIHLMGIKDGPSMYIRTDTSLIQLDMKGQRITGNLADKYILKKINP